MTTLDPNKVIMGSGSRSAEFKQHGDQVWGTIISSAVRQQSDYQSGKPKFYDDGNPMLQVVITLLTDGQLDDDDDGLRTLYARGQMLTAIRAAVVKAGAKGIEDGGRLIVRYVGDAEPRGKGMSGAKQYFAKYELPVRITELPGGDAGEVGDEEDFPF